MSRLSILTSLRPSSLLFLLVLFPLLWAASARAQGGGDLDSLPAWGVVPSPNGGFGPNELEGVAVFSPTDVWAVGDFGDFGYPGPEPATHHWDGMTWQSVPLPAGTPHGELLDIDALSPTDMWAVGGANSTGDSFIFRWDGTEWSAVPHPTSHTYQRLYGVSALAPDDVWAVGTRSDNGGVSLAFSLHWNGTSWSEIATPSPNGGYSALNGVVALAEDDVWAVGDDGSEPRALHWTGSAWQVVPIPAAGQSTSYNALSGVASDDIWAVGEGWSGQITVHWDGTAWSEVPNPAPSGGFGELLDVVAIAPDDAWAVGWFGGAQWETFTMHWDGSAWSEVPSPSPDLSINQLLAVGADSSNNVWAVGEADGTLVLRWDGSAWTVVPSSNVSNASNQFRDVDALSDSDAWAVGNADDEPLTSHWDGAAWQLVPAPDDPKGLFLDSVSMVASNDVWAVGYTGAGGGLDSDPVILHWNGGVWSRVASPEPGGNAVDELHAVVALAEDNVWAVGEYGGTGEEALILHWAGSGWQVVENDCQYGLYGIDALAPDDIWAAGDDTVCHYDGTSWTRINPPSVPLLLGVDAIAPDDVWVVGQITSCGPKSCNTSAYSAHWNGTAFQERDIPGATMEDVQALAPDDVYAVGTFSLGTAVAHWDGSTWREVPVPDPESGGFLNGVSPNEAGGLWAVGSYYPLDFGPQRTLILDVPSETQGAVFGDTTYGGSTVLWVGPVTGSTISNNYFGDYAAAGLPAGTYTFIATGDGCPPQSATVQVYAGEFVRQDFDLCGPLPTPVPTRTPPSGTVTATATATEEPTVTATATATEEPPTATATATEEPPSATATATATATEEPPLPTVTATATEEPPLPTATPTEEPPLPTATATPTEEPPMMLEPASFDLLQATGQGNEFMVELHNTTVQPLVWSAYEAGATCYEPQEVSWMRAEPMVGTVAPNGMMELMLTIDTDGLQPGDYSATLCLLDSQGRRQALPVQVTVTEPLTLKMFLPMMKR